MKLRRLRRHLTGMPELTEIILAKAWPELWLWLRAMQLQGTGVFAGTGGFAGSAGFPTGPIVANNGNLVIPGVQSPNFVSLVQGWQILKNGNAQFNNVSITGTFAGLDFRINSNGIFIYSGAPALGNLVGSWCGAAVANDGFGNSAPAGLAVGLSSGNQLTILPASGQLNLYTHAAMESVPANILAQAVGSGAAEFLIMTMSGPVSTTQIDRVIEEWFSANEGATSSATKEFIYSDTVGTAHPYATNSAQGFNILAGDITAVQPGTGTVAVPAQSETWHALPLSGGFSSPTGAFYRINANGNLELSGQIEYNAGFGSITAGSSVQFSSVPTGYLPPWSMWTQSTVLERNGVSTTQGLAFIILQTNGALLVNPFTTGFTSSISIFSLDGIILPVGV